MEPVPPPERNRQSRFSSVIGFALAILLIGAVAIPLLLTTPSAAPGNWTYSQLLQQAAAHRVSRLTIDGTSGTAVNQAGKTFDVTLPGDTSGLAAQLAADGVNVQYQSSWLDGMGAWLPTVLILGAMVALFLWFSRGPRRGANQAMSFGRSRARSVQEVRSPVRFADVAGVDEAQQELSEVVEFLKTPGKFSALGARIPKGVLMIGPPGTGKTLLAKAVAGEAGTPFFTISGSEFVEMFVGVGASRVRDLFARAKAVAPCIVFVDEIDAVGRRRGVAANANNDEREQTLNQLLVEMDGFETDTHVIVIAATNRPDVLDPALLRAGRFDRHVTLDPPDRRGRLAILGVHVKDKPLGPDVDLEVVASQTPGFCGADLYNLANEAAILAARAGRHQLTEQDFEEAIALVIAGPERKSRLLSGEEKRVVAYHEAGHTLVMKSLPGCDRVRRVSIMSRGSALGWTLGLPDGDRRLVAEDVLRDQLAGLLGGRASEEVSFGRVTSGAENDLEKATDLARRMVVRWGMSDRLGAVTLAGSAGSPAGGAADGEPRPCSEETASAIDAEIRRLVEDAHATARRVLLEEKPALELLARRLMEEETIEEDEIDRIIHPDPTPVLAAMVALP